MALAAYRHVLRSTRIAFQGDIPVLIAARQQARLTFEQARNLDSGSEEAVQSIRKAEDVAKILRENVVQGQVDAPGSGNYKLRIHEHTERGDNESIKMTGEKNTLAGKCCSS